MNRFAAAIIDSLSSSVAVLDENGVIIAVNKAWLHFAEANGAPDKGGYVGANYVDVCHKACLPGGEPADAIDATRFLEGWHSLANGLEVEFSLEYACHAPKIKRWVNVRATRLEIDDVTPPRFVVAHEDVTERVLAQEELFRLSLVAKHTTNGVVITDRTGRVEWVNSAYEQMTGYSLADFLGKKPGSLLSGPLTDPATTAYVGSEAALGRGVHSEVQNYRKDGSTFWAAFEITPVHDDKGALSRFIAVHSDVTERRRALTALSETEQRLRSALLSMQEGMVIHDKSGAVVLCNPAALEIMETTEAEVKGLTVTRLQIRIFQEDGTPWPEDTLPIMISLREGKSLSNVTMGVEVGAGARKWVRVNSSPILSPGGNEPVGAVATFVDITEVLHAEADRARHAQRDRRIAEVLQQAVVPQLPSEIAPGLAICTICLPASNEAEVGGDFYDAFPLASGAIGVVVGDVLGHGLGAALSISKVRFALRGFLSEHPGSHPAEALDRLNYFLYESNRLGHNWENVHWTERSQTLVALTLAVIDPRTAEVQIVSAGMEPAIVVRGSADTIVPANVGGMVLGVQPFWVYAMGKIALAPGDILAIATDGITDAFSRGRREPLGSDGLGLEICRSLRRLGSAAQGNLPDICAETVAESREFAGGKFRDDICLLLVRNERTPEAAAA